MKTASYKKGLLWLIITLTVFACGCSLSSTDAKENTEGISVTSDLTGENETSYVLNLSEIPDYDGIPYVVINENQPDFSEEELTTESYEYYSGLDTLGRCGVAKAVIGTDLMPTEERGDISDIKPTGWHSVKYDLVDKESLYNRCHLIAYQLTGENANACNLITGTRYMNVEGMLPFENMVGNYIRDTGNHVLYRVTPIFEGDNLLAAGVHMEALSVEDQGASVCYNVFVYNVQPGIELDYTTGESRSTEVSTEDSDSTVTAELDDPENLVSAHTETAEYVLNTNTKKFHNPTCPSTEEMKPKNREEFTGYRDELLSRGYEPCGRCNP